MKRFIFIALSVALIISFSSCSEKLSRKVETIETDTSIIESSQTVETDKQSEDVVIFPNFTKEQIADDFDSLVSILNQNNPHFSTAKRMFGSDLNEIVSRYKVEIDNQPEIIDLNKTTWLLRSFISEFGGTGHLTLIDPSYYGSLYYAVDNIKYENKDAMDSYKVLSSEKIVKTYKYLKDSGISHNDIKIAERINVSDVKGVSTNIQDTISINDNLSYKIINDNTVYLNINSFYAENINEDKVKLHDFYMQIKDYENLIIDVTKCDGGSDAYWMDNIIAPNVIERKVSTNYALVKSTGIYKELVNDTEYNRASETYKYISNLPEISNAVLKANET